MTKPLNPTAIIEFTSDGPKISIEDWDPRCARYLEQAWIILQREIIKQRAALLRTAQLKEKANAAVDAS